ncbi:linear amide C-N hydrolase [Enterococcus sp. LJL99]
MLDIPKGTINCDDSYEYAQYTSIYNLTTKEMYLKLYNNLNIQKVIFDIELKPNSTPLIYQLNKKADYTVLSPS